MRILVTLSTNPLFFQEVIIRQLLNSRINKIFLCKSELPFEVPTFSKLQTSIDYRYTNYRFSAFERIDWEHLLQLEGVQLFQDQAIDVHLNLSGNLVETLEYAQTWHPVFDAAYWMEEGKKSGSTLISLRCNKGKTVNSLTFSSDKGILNNTYKALFYLPYLIAKTLAGQRSPENYLPVKQSGNSLFYAVQGAKILLRKLSRRQLNWKLALRRDNQFFKVLNIGKNSFWADPFLLEHQDQTFVFFEELRANQKSGQISCVELNELGEILPKIEVLVKDFHLSFPNVFRHEGQIYMLPEQSESNRLDLYIATDFPRHWEVATTLIDNRKIIDPEIIFYEDRYWLFCNVLEAYENENNERLSIFFADSLFSQKWTEHLQNPVIINKEHARNAGKIIFENGKILRPAQSCAKNYGESLSLRKINVLNPATYVESQNLKIDPPEGFVGLHTFNKIGKWQIFDLLKKE